MKEFKLREGDQFIKLVQLLKASGMMSSGSCASQAIRMGNVSVNGTVCLMRGKKIHDGDIVAYNGEIIHVHKIA